MAIKANPVKKWRFDVSILTPDVLSQLNAPTPSFSIGFNNISGIKDGVEVEGITDGHSGAPEPIPQSYKRNSFTMARGMDKNGYLFAWYKQVKDVATDYDFADATSQYWSEEMRIIQENTIKITIDQVWPSSYEIADFDAQGDDIQFETVTMQYQGIHMDRSI
jgi:phage tail-like protein